MIRLYESSYNDVPSMTLCVRHYRCLGADISLSAIDKPGDYADDDCEVCVGDVDLDDYITEHVD